MYVCKNCGNYYQFNGSAIATITNRLNAKQEEYEAETEYEYEEVDFINCIECGSNDVEYIDVNTLPERLKEEVHNTVNMGYIDIDVMKGLKVFVNK